MTQPGQPSDYDLRKLTDAAYHLADDLHADTPQDDSPTHRVLRNAHDRVQHTYELLATLTRFRAGDPRHWLHVLDHRDGKHYAVHVAEIHDAQEIVASELREESARRGARYADQEAARDREWERTIEREALAAQELSA